MITKTPFVALTSALTASTTGRRRSLAAFLTVGLLLAGLTACNTTHQVRESDKDFSGFLGDYSQLKPGAEGQANFLYVDKSADWKNYTKIYIKPIELWQSADPASNLGSLALEDQQMLVSYLHTSLANTLGKDFTLVGQAGPGVLVIHGAITDAGKSKAVMNVISSVVPVSMVLSAGKTALTGKGSGVGSVSIEVEFCDGQTGQRVAAIVDSRAGTKAVRTKFDGTWSDVKMSFDWWAAQADARLLKLKSGGPVPVQP